MRLSPNVVTIALLGAAGCTGTTSFAPSEGPYTPSRLRGRGVEVALSVSPSIAAPGDTIRLTVTAHNSTDRRIQIGFQCGPAMDAVITGPGAGRVSVLHEMLGPNGAFTCELGPRHFADPGETETVRLTWRAPARGGTYTAVGGLRGQGDQLHTLSPPVLITIR
jgi:hypothetical protein